MPGKCFLKKILFGAKERILRVEFESTWNNKDGKLTLKMQKSNAKKGGICQTLHEFAETCYKTDGNDGINPLKH